jgi:hypothetical protein
MSKPKSVLIVGSCPSPPAVNNKMLIPPQVLELAASPVQLASLKPAYESQ